MFSLVMRAALCSIQMLVSNSTIYEGDDNDDDDAEDYDHNGDELWC